MRPHKITYYLERRDPAFDQKMAQVLCFYREVALMRDRSAAPDAPLAAYISYDEKPGIQAIGTTAPDRPPVPGVHATVGRDHEYVRHGTVTLMAAMDLLTGHVYRAVVDRHRSREFVAFLRTLNDAYPQGMTLRLILDNHAAHISRETRAYLASMPNRFEFVFTPKHASWLNLIETFFSKVARTVLRGIRVASTDELKQRLERYIDELKFANWLAHPNELGRPPDRLEITDHRLLDWPPAGDRIPLWIVRYEVDGDSAPSDSESDCGLVGSTTWCFFDRHMDLRPPTRLREAQRRGA